MPFQYYEVFLEFFSNTLIPWILLILRPPPPIDEKAITLELLEVAIVLRDKPKSAPYGRNTDLKLNVGLNVGTPKRLELRFQKGLLMHDWKFVFKQPPNMPSMDR